MIAGTFKTKTFWTGMVGVITGVGLIVQGDIANGAMTTIMSLLAIFGRDAISKTQQQQ